MSAIRDITVPDIGDFKNIPVIEILVKPGDVVAKDTPLLVLESDKATLDIPSPEHGRVKELKIAVGDRVSSGSLLLTLDSEDADMPPVPTADPPVPREVLSVVKTTPDDTSPASPTLAMAQPTEVNRGSLRLVESQRPPHASPSLRRVAREYGIDLHAIQGSGPRGRIQRQDLQNFVKACLARPAQAAGAGELKFAPWPDIDFSKFGAIERVPLSKVRKLSGANLARNAVVIPHVTNFEDADITDLEAFRQTLKSEAHGSGATITILAFLIKAAAATLIRYPVFNSSLDGDELVLKRYCHIGFAADTPSGLLVPVIRDVDSKGIVQIASQAAALATRAREGKLTPGDMQGGCFTVSSLGGIGGTGFTPIINAPEVAILGATRAQMKPVWDGKDFRPRLIMRLSLSWDHRVVDGAAAARFLVHLSALLGDFRRVLL